MRLRYIGPHPTVFAYRGVALVDPGGEFWVADPDAGAFLTRGDVEEADPVEPADDDTPGRKRARKTPAPALAGDHTPIPTEQSE